MTKDQQWLLKEKYHGEQTEAFWADCERLAAGEPLGYVIGWVPFLDCKIWLDERPLIPRPETEFWIERAIAVIQRASAAGKPADESETQLVLARNHLAADALLPTRRPAPLRILDLCAGSGAIGVAVAQSVPEALVDFAEIDERLLPTIEKNCTENLSVNCKVGTVIPSDLFSTISERYDFILSNPPYIDPALDRTEASVKAHEPHHALYGGDKGMALIETIITECPQHLTPNGQLWLEHEPEQVADITALAHQAGLTIETHTDQYDLSRYSILTME